MLDLFDKLDVVLDVVLMQDGGGTQTIASQTPGVCRNYKLCLIKYNTIMMNNNK